MNARRSYLILLTIMAVISLVYLLNTWGRCESDYDCKTGELCGEDGTCQIDYSCDADSDCPDRMHCSKNICIDDKTCEKNKDCGLNSYCSGLKTCKKCDLVLSDPTLIGDIQVIETLNLCIGDLTHPKTSIRLEGKYKATSAVATPVLNFAVPSDVPLISRFKYKTTDNHIIHIERTTGNPITVDLAGVPYGVTIVL